jgi:hypothetical protein
MRHGRLASIILVFVVVSIAFLAYFLLLGKEVEIYIQSFDREVKFTLGEYNVKSITSNINRYEDYTDISVTDTDEFINDVILTNDSYVGQINIDKETYSTTVYYFIENGYSYYVDENEDFFALRTCNLQLPGPQETADLSFQFIPAFFANFDTYYTYEDMSSPNFTSFNDYKEFYQDLQSDKVIIDDVDSKITIIPYASKSQEYVQGYRVVIQFDDNGFIINWEELS